MIDVALFTVTPVAALAPNATVAPDTKPVPVIVTMVPPLVDPVAGLTADTVGAVGDATYVNWSAELVADVPPGVTAVTSTVPVPAGLVAVIDVELFTVKLVAGVEPKSTAVAPVRFVPVMVTVVPPAAGPLVGLTADTVGAEM